MARQPRRQPDDADEIGRMLNEATPRKKHELLAAIVTERLQHIKTNGDDLWHYKEGKWTAVPHAKKWLRSIISNAIEENRAAFEPSIKLVSETFEMIWAQSYVEHPVWDNHGMIPLINGLYDIETERLLPHKPEHNTTQWAPVEYNKMATCPEIGAFLGEGLDQAHIDMLMEIVGMSIYRGPKPKDLRRALVLHGPSNTGKSQVLQLILGILSDDPITTPLDIVGTSHGTMAFRRNAPWVLEEAFDSGKWHFSSVTKMLIEGGLISVNRKNGPMETVRYDAPVFWATNVSPQFKEATKAIVNRLMIIGFHKVFDPKKPVGIAKHALAAGYATPAQYLLDRERSGFLNRALDGLKRALARGHYVLTKETEEALEEVHLESNLCARWVAEGYVVEDPNYKVRVTDLMASYCAYYVTSVSNSMQTPDPRIWAKELKGLGLNTVHEKTGNVRYIGGLKLSPEGLAMWQLIKDGGIPMPARAHGTSPSKEEVNRIRITVPTRANNKVKLGSKNKEPRE